MSEVRGHVDQPPVGFEVAKLVKPRVELGQQIFPYLVSTRHSRTQGPREMAGRQDRHEAPQRFECEVTQGARTRYRKGRALIHGLHLSLSNEMRLLEGGTS